MQTIYRVKVARKIDLLIGDCNTTEVKASFDRRIRRLRAHRVEVAKLKLLYRDYDGSEFLLFLNIETGYLELAEPYMRGSDYEAIMMKQLWRTISRLLNASLIVLSDLPPDRYAIEHELDFSSR